IGGMQKKARRDEEHNREQRRVAKRGDENRREISDSRRLLVSVTVRRCHTQRSLRARGGADVPAPSAAGISVTIPRFSIPAALIAAIVRITSPYGTRSSARMKTWRSGRSCAIAFSLPVKSSAESFASLR